MRRRDFLKAVGLGTWALVMPGCAGLLGTGLGGASRRRAPNIVYVLADDLGYGDVSALNEKSKLKTAHTDHLAAEGMRFTDAHSNSAVCSPTRYGILTGRYCFRSRLKKGVLDGYSPPLIEEGRMTVASFLKKQGYHTACIGKWHLGWDWTKNTPGKREDVDFTGPVRNGPDVNGFDYYYCHCGSLDMAPYVYVENGKATSQPDRMTESKARFGWWRKGPTGADFDHADVLPNVTRRGVRYIRDRAATGEPFLLYLALPAPHTPILPTREFQGKSGTNPYGDFVLQVDASIGQIAQAVEDAGIRENTLFIVASDNGCSPEADFKELAGFGHRPSYVYRGYKSDAYDGGHRIPFVVRWPARVRAGSVCGETICLTDLLATCADILGDALPGNAGEDSVSILPALLGKKRGKPLREATVHHSIDGMFAIRQGPWKLIQGKGSGGWSLPEKSVPPGAPTGQLYNMEEDVGETANLYEKRPDVVKRLTDLLERYKREGRSARRELPNGNGE